jgi:drug/metabolite transporter, DME family
MEGVEGTLSEQKRRGRGVLLVLAAATLWGTLGTIYTLASERYGLTPLTIVFWRAALAAIGVGAGMLVLAVARREGLRAFKIRRRDLPLFLAFGLLGGTAFFLLYVYAVLLVGVAVAVVLLYTSPVFVALMAWRFLGEGFGWRKGVALTLTLAGAVLVSQVLNSEVRLDALGLLCALASALAYALYSILGKRAMSLGYAIPTTLLYVYGTGALGLLIAALLTEPAPLLAMGADAGAWSVLLMLATVQTLGALGLYISGLRLLQAGVAGIVATFELVVASALAVVVLNEPVGWMQLSGGGLILGAVLLLGLGER